MAEEWSTFGLDLHLPRVGARRRESLERALREAIRDGRLAAGGRLPSTRALAADLGFARGTVTEAYAQLVAEGWLTARRGSGTRVAGRAAGATGAAPLADRTPVSRWPGAGNSPLPAAAPPRHDLRPGSPDLTAFPRAEWLAAARRALAGAAPEALGYSDPRGRPELRAALAEYLGRARGVRADPERIVVCAGFGQSLSLLCEALAARGARTLAAEAHGLSAHRAIAVRAGLSIRRLPVDGGGARVQRLGGADAALLTPAHQFPIGVVLAPERRALAVAWAERHCAIVIEDDYDGEFRYDRQPVGAMQALAPERVVYAGTASKSLAPGLRLAWLVLPRSLLDPVASAQALRGGPGVLDQLTLAELIGSGAYDRHVRRARLAYRRRRDRLLEAARHLAPDVRVTGIAAGLHALLELPAGTDEADVVERGAGRGLALEGLRAYAPAGDPRGPALVIGYATPPEHAYTGALARLTAVLGELTPAASPAA